MSDSELVDYFDEDGNILGVCTRKEADEKNYTYSNVIVFVFTSDDRVWIQKRSLKKLHYPGIWDVSACGALAHGEDPLRAAERELQEEMKLNCKLKLVEKFLNAFPSEDKKIIRKRMSYLFVGICDDVPEGNHEVEAVAAFTTDELLADVQANPDNFIPSFEIELRKALKAS